MVNSYAAIKNYVFETYLKTPGYATLECKMKIHRVQNPT